MINHKTRCISGLLVLVIVTALIVSVFVLAGCKEISLKPPFPRDIIGLAIDDVPSAYSDSDKISHKIIQLPAGSQYEFAIEVNISQNTVDEKEFVYAKAMLFTGNPNHEAKDAWLCPPCNAEEGILNWTILKLKGTFALDNPADPQYADWLNGSDANGVYSGMVQFNLSENFTYIYQNPLLANNTYVAVMLYTLNGDKYTVARIKEEIPLPQPTTTLPPLPPISECLMLVKEDYSGITSSDSNVYWWEDLFPGRPDWCALYAGVISSLGSGTEGTLLTAEQAQAQGAVNNSVEMIFGLTGCSEWSGSQRCFSGSDGCEGFSVLRWKESPCTAPAPITTQNQSNIFTNSFCIDDKGNITDHLFRFFDSATTVLMTVSGPPIRNVNHIFMKNIGDGDELWLYFQPDGTDFSFYETPDGKNPLTIKESGTEADYWTDCTMHDPDTNKKRCLNKFGEAVVVKTSTPFNLTKLRLRGEGHSHSARTFNICVNQMIEMPYGETFCIDNTGMPDNDYYFSIPPKTNSLSENVKLIDLKKNENTIKNVVRVFFADATEGTTDKVDRLWVHKNMEKVSGDPLSYYTDNQGNKSFTVEFTPMPTGPWFECKDNNAKCTNTTEQDGIARNATVIKSDTPFDLNKLHFQVDGDDDLPGGKFKICVETAVSGGAAPGQPAAITGNVVFVTSGKHTGNLGGIAGADAICMQEAAAAGISGVVRAWISDAMTGAISRFQQSSLPYVLTDGTQVASNWTDLTDSTLSAPINVNASGDKITTIAGEEKVWTNSLPSGNLKTNTGSEVCNLWASDSSSNSGYVGDAVEIGAKWTDVGSTMNCNEKNRLYCIAEESATAGDDDDDTTDDDTTDDDTTDDDTTDDDTTDDDPGVSGGVSDYCIDNRGKLDNNYRFIAIDRSLIYKLGFLSNGNNITNVKKIFLVDVTQKDDYSKLREVWVHDDSYYNSPVAFNSLKRFVDGGDWKNDGDCKDGRRCRNTAGTNTTMVSESTPFTLSSMSLKIDGSDGKRAFKVCLDADTPETVTIPDTGYWTDPAGEAECNSGYALSNYDCNGRCNEENHRIFCKPVPSGITLSNRKETARTGYPACQSGYVAVGYKCKDMKCSKDSMRLYCMKVNGGSLDNDNSWRKEHSAGEHDCGANRGFLTNVTCLQSSSSGTYDCDSVSISTVCAGMLPYMT
ncbi:hypothetical protein ACFL96_06675 [Thermoproteota archaeon]